MLRNYFKIAVRNLFKNKFSSMINIGGLAIGMAVALLIGLWIYDEVSYDKSTKNYDRIGQVWQFVSFSSGVKSSYQVLPIPLATDLRSKYPDIKYASLSQHQQVVLSDGEKKLSEMGNYVQPEFMYMMSPKMISGNAKALTDMNAIVISQSLAKSFFGSGNAINKIIKINNKLNVKVSGVFEDFPNNSSFNDVQFFAAWDLYESDDDFVKNSRNSWGNNSWQIYVQLKDGADFKGVSAKIKDIAMKLPDPPGYKPEYFVHPMSRWHLFGDFQNGVNTGGLITFVWLFGIIGLFVLLLACINFMNLSTARSEKRAKEVGIRKAIGSMRQQLVAQFLSESILTTIVSFVFAIILAELFLPFFNNVAGKKMTILWTSPFFWIFGFGFSLVTGLIAGSYPALYLSSFNAVKVLKGTFRASRFASIPRKILVVLQFTVSVTLIIGTIIVFKQIQYAKNRSVGYERGSLIEIQLTTPELAKHFDALRTSLLNTGAVSESSESSCSIAGENGGTTDISWEGKKPNEIPLVMTNLVTHEYGKTIGWKLMEGRDFSRDFATDSAAIVMNQAAVKLMGFKRPLDQFIKSHGRDYKVIGVTNDMVRGSPFEPIAPAVFVLNYRDVRVIDIRLSPKFTTSESLSKVETIFKKFNPSSPFTYSFVDDDFAKKFLNEERIGKLASFFAALAIFISCLGLFGLASFVAEQRTKEIGVRKVLGASVIHVWGLLSKEFIILVGISLVIAIPIANHYMKNWLMNYEYRAPVSWWIFAVAGIGAIFITLLTVSFQAIKAALANPVKSLRTE